MVLYIIRKRPVKTMSTWKPPIYNDSVLIFTDMNNGVIADMVDMGITESFQVKRQVLMSSAEAAEMILRVDNIVKSAPRQRMPDHCM